MQLDQIVLNKTKEKTYRYSELFGHSGKKLSTHVTNDLT
jgi:hypothetical protein